MLKFNQGGVIQVVLLLVLLAGVGIGVYLSQQKQIFRPEASPAETDWTSSEMGYINNLEQPTEIFEVRLDFDQSENPQLDIKDIKIKNGYVSDSPDPQTGYRIEIVDKTDQVLITKLFNLPNLIVGPPPLDGDKSNEAPKKLDKFKFAINLPYFETGVKINLYDESNQLTSTLQLLKAEKINNKPKFKSTTGDKIKKSRNMVNILIKAVKAAGDGYVDITFIGDGFTSTDLSLFHTNVDQMIQNILTYEPYKTKASQLRFHFVDNTSSLGCYYDAQTGRLIICDDYLVKTQVNNNAAPWDEIVVIKNNPNYGGSGQYGGDIAVAYNGSWGSQVFVHELGHSFAELIDEYYLVWPYGKTDKNCYNGTPPNTLWVGIVDSANYFPECNYSNWYRSSETSLMRAIDSRILNPVSQKIIHEF